MTTISKMRCLVYFISPTHIISSLIAINTLHPNKNIKTTFLIVSTEQNFRDTKKVLNLVKSLLSKVDFSVKIIHLTDYKFTKLLNIKNRYAKKNQTTLLFKEEEYDEIYYPHDVIGTVYPRLCESYPKAIRICYGDAFGFVYEKEVVLSLLRQPHKKALLTEIRDIVIKFLPNLQKNIISRDISETQSKYIPHKAVLIMPVDQSGNFLNKVSLTVCSKKTVDSVVNQCIESTKQLQEYIDYLLNRYQKQEKVLLLTENFTEGNFINFNKEIDMYCSLIEKYADSNAVIFLKSHPLETLNRNNLIAKRFKSRFKIVQLNNRFSKYPVEIWKNLIMHCDAISMSSSVLTLKYLFNVDVIQPMTDKFIEQWFPEWTWVSLKNARKLYMEPLKRLCKWDRHSILWSGNKYSF